MIIGLLSGCNSAIITMSDLRELDNLYYQGEASIPFTGMALNERKNGMDTYYSFKEGRIDDIVYIDDKGERMSLSELGKAFNESILEGAKEIVDDGIEPLFLCETAEANYFTVEAHYKFSSSLFNTVKRIPKQDGKISFSDEARCFLKKEMIIKSRPGFKGFKEKE